jgi:hypothetical protein
MPPIEYCTILKYRMIIALFSVDEVCLSCRKACLDRFEEHEIYCLELSCFKYMTLCVLSFFVFLIRCAGIFAEKETHANFLTDPLE